MENVAAFKEPGKERMKGVQHVSSRMDFLKLSQTFPFEYAQYLSVDLAHIVPIEEFVMIPAITHHDPEILRA